MNTLTPSITMILTKVPSASIIARDMIQWMHEQGWRRRVIVHPQEATHSQWEYNDLSGEPMAVAFRTPSHAVMFKLVWSEWL